MLVLIGIGLAAGFITAISPCVLPVLPIVFAGGATGGRRKPFAIIAGLDPQLHGLHALRRLAPAQARTARGPPPQPRDRAPLPRRGDAALPEGRGDRPAAVPPPDEAAERRPRRRAPARREPRARVRAVRRPGAGGDHGRRGDAGRRLPRDRAHARLRDRRGDPDAARRVRRPRRDDQRSGRTRIASGRCSASSSG